MERLRRTVVQLEEAKRFILDGEVARLRLALILLDNAVEVMLHRRVKLSSSGTVADIVQCGLSSRNILRRSDLGHHAKHVTASS